MYLHSPRLWSLRPSDKEVAEYYRQATWARERAKHVNDPDSRNGSSTWSEDGYRVYTAMNSLGG